MIFLRVTISRPMNLGGSLSPKRGCPSADDAAAASARQTWWLLLLWAISWGLDEKFEDPFRESEALDSVLDLEREFMGLNLYLKSHEGCVINARVLGFDGKERNPFECKTACILEQSLSPLRSPHRFPKAERESSEREREDDMTKMRWMMIFLRGIRGR